MDHRHSKKLAHGGFGPGNIFADGRLLAWCISFQTRPQGL